MINVYADNVVSLNEKLKDFPSARFYILCKIEVFFFLLRMKRSLNNRGFIGSSEGYVRGTLKNGGVARDLTGC